MKNFFSLIVKIFISFVLLLFLFSRIDLNKTISYIRQTNSAYFISALLLFFFIIFLALIRWNILLSILKKDIAFKRVFFSYCGGLFFNVLLPSTIGGDIARTVDMSVHTQEDSKIFATVFLDRLSGFLALVVIALLGFFYAYFTGLIKDIRLLFFILILAGVVFLAFLIIFNKTVFNLLNKIIRFKFLQLYFTKFHSACYSFRSQKVVLVKTVSLSLFIQMFFSIVFYLLGKSLGIELSLVYFLIFVPIINTISFIPISFGGLGLRDNAAVVLFSSLKQGVEPDQIAAMTLLVFAFLFFVGLVGGVIYGATFYTRRIQRN